MNIRAIRSDDIPKLKVIHDKYFRNEFVFPEFLTEFLCAFLVEDDSGEIITAGGVRTIAESIIITNKAYDIKERRQGLNQILDASEFVCHKFKYNQLHAFITDNNWERHLLKVGFRHIKGSGLVIDI